MNIKIELLNTFEKKFVEGSVDFVAKLVEGIGDLLRTVQTGNVSDYISLVIVGVIFITLILKGG